MKRKVEILAPAGSFESMMAAAAAGADAVYIGGNRFGARAYADNLDEEKMLKAIDYMHLHGCKIYMTVNTLVKEEELNSLFHYLEPYYKRGLDAVIVQDLGALSYIRNAFPDLAIHVSTQMTLTGPRGAKLLIDRGISRIVTARELSLREIEQIYKETGVEIESFVHGALCYCYSGQCLFSSLIGGRSGNRGRCAQTCRLPFDVKRDGKVLNQKDERYMLSLKDLCTLDILPDIIEAGVYSMKIEGRMKSPRYTAGVVSIYRKYVDLYLEKGKKGYKVEEADRKKLLDLFDRGGQTEGYYRHHNGRDMVVLKEKPQFRQENKELHEFLDKNYVQAILKEPVIGHVMANEGEPLLLTLHYKDISVTTEGAVVQTAKSQPMSDEKVLKQINKTGNTPFFFEKLTADVKGTSFVPVQELNELRRSAFSKLEEEILKPYQRETKVIEGDSTITEFCLGKEEKGQDESYILNVSLECRELFETVLSEAAVDGIYLDCTAFVPGSWKSVVKNCHDSGKKCLLVLPPIYRSEAECDLQKQKELFLQAGFDGAVIRSLEEIGLMQEWCPELPLVFDYGIYTMNHLAEAEIREMTGSFKKEKKDLFTLPVELNSKELERRNCAGGELIVYGYLPVMVSAQCMKKTIERCSKKPELLWMKDRMGKEFPVKNHCSFCYNIIYNSSPLSLLKEKKRIEQLGPKSLRLNFTIEQPDEAKQIIQAFSEGFIEGKESFLPGEFTRGHFKRGIE